ncbi:hypothetical protein NESM_000864700 [Novymonas esmeraldas]|uniref:Uncharacterized protein n=1 Tax=Novymonas esmeraldas TaxID=1808958 RepID=A0AAW0EY94_9TRYP
MVLSGPVKPGTPLPLSSSVPKAATTGLQTSFASLQHVTNSSMTGASDPLTMSSGTTFSPLASTMDRSSTHLVGWDKAGSLHDMDADDVAAAFARSSRSLDGVSPSASMAGVYAAPGRPALGTGAASAKRRYPHLFTQLAHELRWMHNSLRHGHHGGTASRRRHPTDTSSASTRLCAEDADRDDELVVTSTQSSLRRPSTLQGAAATPSGRDTRPARWAAVEDGAVRQVYPAPLRATTPDPHSPAACKYVLRHPVGDEGDSARDGTRSDGTTPVLATPFVEDSLSSLENDSYREDLYSRYGDPSSIAADGSRDVEDGGDGVSEAEAGSAASDGGEGASDAYDVFLHGVAALHRQLHALEHSNACLRALYEQEQRARLQSNRRGQHLQWTRTVDAANTVHFWREKVQLLRLFESQFLAMLSAFQNDLKLVDPATVLVSAAHRAPTDAVAAAVEQARRAFLVSPGVITAQQRHLQQLEEQMRTCWQASATLREELRHFEQWSPRVPCDTFATATMDAEHFIAVLPPRTSAFGLRPALSHTSMHSIDSLGSGCTPPLLLTAQNLSPASSDDCGEENRTGAQATAQVSIIRSGDSTHAASPLPCLKQPATITSGHQSPITPKRLKYVICSASFEAEDGQGGSATNRSASPRVGSAPPAGDSLTRRRAERHVTFALEPEVLDARPRCTAHGRIAELLDQICLDKQAPWSALPLLQTAARDHRAQLEDWRAEMALEEVMGSVPSITLQGRTFDTAGKDRDSGDSSAPPLPEAGNAKRPGKLRRTSSKVKPKACTACLVM